MSIYVGSTEISDLKLGGNTVGEVYVGDCKVRPTKKYCPYTPTESTLIYLNGAGCCEGQLKFYLTGTCLCRTYGCEYVTDGCYFSCLKLCWRYRNESYQDRLPGFYGWWFRFRNCETFDYLSSCSWTCSWQGDHFKSYYCGRYGYSMMACFYYGGYNSCFSIDLQDQCHSYDRGFAFATTCCADTRYSRILGVRRNGSASYGMPCHIACSERPSTRFCGCNIDEFIVDQCPWSRDQINQYVENTKSKYGY